MSTEPTSAHDRKLVGLSLILLTGACSFLGFILYSQHQLAAPARSAPDSNVGIPGFHAALITTADREANITKAKRLRELFRPWALAHQHELTRMLSAHNDDREALAGVYNVLPHQPQFAGAGFTNSDLAEGRYPFTWNVGVENIHLSARALADPMVRRNHEKTLLFAEDRKHKDFIAYHDIALSQAVNPGIKMVKLWASGRITETTLNVQHSAKATMFDNPAEEEIVPHYDFLP